MDAGANKYPELPVTLYDYGGWHLHNGRAKGVEFVKIWRSWNRTESAKGIRI